MSGGCTKVFHNDRLYDLASTSKENSSWQYLGSSAMKECAALQQMITYVDAGLAWWWCHFCPIACTHVCVLQCFRLLYHFMIISRSLELRRADIERPEKPTRQREICTERDCLPAGHIWRADLQPCSLVTHVLETYHIYLGCALSIRSWGDEHLCWTYCVICAWTCVKTLHSEYE